MKRIITTVSLLLALAAPTVAMSSAAAVDIFGSCGAGSASGTPGICTDIHAGEGSTTNPIVGIIASVITILSFVIGIAAVIGIIINAIRMMVANGDSNAVASARSGVLYSLIGVAVAILAQMIVRIALGVIGN